MINVIKILNHFFFLLNCVLLRRKQTTSTAENTVSELADFSRPFCRIGKSSTLEVENF